MPNKNKRTTRKKSVAKTRKQSAAKRMTTKRKVTTKAASKRSPARKKKFSAKRKRVTNTGVVVGTASLPSVERLQSRDEEAGDLQGLSKRAVADSESVQELLEEGNALEAEAVQGVENALDADQGEVQTHEVPEDDPPEYLDKDR
jgi:hypothetical protein